MSPEKTLEKREDIVSEGGRGQLFPSLFLAAKKGEKNFSFFLPFSIF